MKRRLTQQFCRDVRPGSKTRTHGDGRGGHGLTLMVTPSGAKCWYQRIILDGTAVNIGLGGFPDVSLAQARDRAVTNRAKVIAGEDPRRPRTARPRLRTAAGGATLGECMDAVMAAMAPRWKNAAKTEAQWRSSLRRVPGLLAMPVAEVTAPIALETLQAVMNGTPTVAKDLRARLAKGVNRAVVQGLRADNPFDLIGPELVEPRGMRGNHASMPPGQVPAAVAAMLAADTPSTLALAFQVATAMRPMEAHRARWSEIDGKGSVWTIPASRMKAGAEHRVPLSALACAVLERARRHSGGALVFPAPRGGLMALSRPAQTMTALGFDAFTAHGFRASFKTWAGESGQERELAELSLAHRIGDAVEQAYARSDLLQRRRAVMDAWSAHLLAR